MARPRANRWHRTPTALFGGVGIFAAFLLSFLLRRPAALAGDALIAACAACMFLLGLVDDLIQLKPYTKLVGQIVISTALTTGGMRLHLLPSQVLDQALSIFWLVGITNAMNLLDNLDGLAAGVATIAGGFLVYFCHIAGQHEAAELVATLTGAVLGFLVFNFNPASIFMGDCGSLFIGFALGSMGIVTTTPGIRRNIVAVIAIPVFVLLIPILDTVLVTLARSTNGRQISQGGRDHTSHRLVALGFSERKAALLLWSASALAGVTAVVMQRVAQPMTLFLLLCVSLVFAFFLLFIGRIKIYEPVAGLDAGRGRAVLPTIADFAYKRRIPEVLGDAVVVVLAFYGAYLLLAGGEFAPPNARLFLLALPLVIVVQVTVLLALGVYRGLWRYAAWHTLGSLLRAIGGAWAVGCLVIAVIFPRDKQLAKLVILDGALLLVGILGSRLAARWLSLRFVPLRDGNPLPQSLLQAESSKPTPNPGQVIV